MKLPTLQESFKDYITGENLLNEPIELYDPIHYIMQIGGKRIRPLLTLLSYQMYKDDVEKAMPLAYSIELFHNFTLMHDDIMDEATHRRGQLAVHQKYSVNTGILSGDAMLLTAYRYLLDADMQLEDIKLFNKTAIEICEGQQMDMNFETLSNVSIEDYLKMIRLKTAVLLGLALQLGAIKAGASSADIKHLYQFGVNMGIAFQLHDDMLDAFSPSQKTGKKQGGDIMQKKKTYLHLKTRELLQGEEKKKYLEVFEDDTISNEERVASVMKYYNTTVVKEYSIQTEEAYFTLAISHLEAVSVSDQKKAALRNLAHELMQRTN